MPTINQLKRNPRTKRKSGRNNRMGGGPQRRGVCVKVFLMRPKKPNSALRAAARVRLTTRRLVTVHIPGEGHTLNKHSSVLVRPGRVKDLPGVKHRAIHGKLDLLGLSSRRKARSKYGTRKPRKR